MTLSVPFALPSGLAVVRITHNERALLSIEGATLCATGTHVDRDALGWLWGSQGFADAAWDAYCDERDSREREAA